ncbi:MAG: hypothetical protein ACRDSR_28355 [Pseudonocardiaceae bacterium]
MRFPNKDVLVGRHIRQHCRAGVSSGTDLDGCTPATASDDAVVLWDLTNRNQTSLAQQTLTGDTGLVESMAFSFDEPTTGRASGPAVASKGGRRARRQGP